MLDGNLTCQEIPGEFSPSWRRKCNLNCPSKYGKDLWITCTVGYYKGSKKTVKPYWTPVALDFWGLWFCEGWYGFIEKIKIFFKVFQDEFFTTV